MPEIRYNIVTREWVIIATERAKRPEQFAQPDRHTPAPPPYLATCPFCPGNENQTPPETDRFDVDGRWRVRVVENKFAALDRNAPLERHTQGLKRSISGTGLHEVIVETPAHDKHLALLSEPDFDLVIQAYRRRYLAITADPRVAHATLFRNHGERAGTSLQHPHSQIVGTPIIPPQVRERMVNALSFYDREGQCLFCALLADEMLDGARVVASNSHFVAFLPFAALNPFHLWIFPSEHEANFGDATDEQLASLSRVLRLVLRKLCFSLANPDYNLTVRTTPREARGSRYHHWYLSIIPRVTRIAGFELGSGMFINTALPEASAAFLRQASAD
ncbi:MAG TPA: galactose-1-phosphate uridylyltransferase [Candidatus Acidoferrum sp.]|nr:galactose-1-phosphate uridylyltransferase [Candidatus Acidoferrum sp.]